MATTDYPTRRLPRTPGTDADLETLVEREWLVTNGLGGYASGTVGGLATRRYHGVLVAALPNPLGRMVMLNHLIERVLLPDGTRVALGGEERVGRELAIHGARHLREFRLDLGLPVWTYEVDGHLLEKRVVMPHRQNTTMIRYALLEGDGPLTLELQPTVHFRGYEEPVNLPMQEGYRLETEDGQYLVRSNATELPPLRLMLDGDECTLTMEKPETQRINELLYRVEAARGYEYQGDLWTPGWLSVKITRDHPASLTASAEPGDIAAAISAIEALQLEQERRERLLRGAPASAQGGVAAELVVAADQFVISPAGRVGDRVRAWAVGDEVRTIIAGYHWFTDWGRDTMISLDGLTLQTGRVREAAAILREFAFHTHDGLIPNMFPDGSNEGLYHTADATLWFFHATDRYVRTSGDRALLRALLPVFRSVIEHHLEGTRFGIHVDPSDGLLTQSAEGYQLTWMDAKVNGWVVTPRRGKAVEINALWYNALCTFAGWLRQEEGESAAAPYLRHANQTRKSFNDRFWYAEGGYLYDVVDGPDGDSAECRPNQVFAISLDHPVLDREHWESVMHVVHDRLLTPYGLRSLAPGSAHYQPKYYGDLMSRDAAYHQGTVWAWLIGPWVDAWLKLHPDDLAGARRFLEPLAEHLNDFGVGSVAEIFDAEPPFTPRGCIAQAWSVGELLRCWIRTERGSA